MPGRTDGHLPRMLIRHTTINTEVALSGHQGSIGLQQSQQNVKYTSVDMVRMRS